MSYTDAEIVDTVQTADGGTMRARIVQDIYADEPENDGGCPIVRIDYTHRDGYWSGQNLSYGSYYNDGLPMPASEIIARFNIYDKRTAIDTFERYLRIWHDGNLIEYGPNQATDYTYVAYVTRTLWESWGNTGEVGKADLDEYRAWVEGSVYAVIVEELKTWVEETPTTDPAQTIETWETIDSCGGFYGYDYADESAREQLAYFAKS